MKISTIVLGVAGIFAVAVAAVAIPDWHPPVHGTQLGPDGSSMVQFDNTSPWRVMAPPQAEPPAPAGGPSATQKFHNLKIMTDGSAAEFVREHRAMTAWVSPKQGCSFCHTGNDYAADTNPMKAVARQMMGLTRHINTAWAGHVGPQGVTCFSCHRGEPVPPETWFARTPKQTPAMFAGSENWNENADTVRKFFPDNGWALYFLQDEPIHVQSTTALRSNTVAPELVAKRVYEFMMQMSDGIGVNCGYCHNSRTFADWKQSTPNRWTGYDAIRMTRDIDKKFLFQEQDFVPQVRDLLKKNSLVIAPNGRADPPPPGLAVCATCHYGHTKPDTGSATLANYPAYASKKGGS